MGKELQNSQAQETKTSLIDKRSNSCHLVLEKRGTKLYVEAVSALLGDEQDEQSSDEQDEQ